MQIQEEMVLDPSLKLYLPLYKRDGAQFISDDAGGRLCTRTSVVHSPELGDTFDGTASYIAVSPYADLMTTQGTLMFWTKGSGRAPVTASDTASNNRFEPWIISTGALNFYITIGGVYTQGLTLPAGTYNITDFFCTILASDGSKTYCDINGVNKALTVADGANNGDWLGDLTAPNNFSVGSLRRVASVYFTGTIGEVIVYNRCLTLIERQGIYELTKWRYR